MLPYLIPIFLSTYLSIRYDVNRKDDVGKRIGSIFLFVYLTLLIGLRYKVGGDTINYMGDYDWRVPLSQWKFTWIDKFQPGYTFLCAIGKSLSPEFYIFQIIHSLLINSLLFYFIYSNTKYFFASLLTLFLTCYFYFSTEILRESIAVLIFVLNYKNLYDGKWTKYYLGVFLCCLFHFSAIFLVIIPFLRWIKFNKIFIILIIGEVIISTLFEKILLSLSSYTVLDKINNYIDETSHGMLADILSLIRSCGFPIIFIVLIKFGLRREVKFENMIAIMSLFGLAGFFYPIIFGRLTNYFILFFSIAIADECVNIIRSNRKLVRTYAKVLIFLMLFTYGSEYIMYQRYTLWYPYSSVIKPVEISREYANKMLLNR